jgi:hypothetical protein
MRGKACSRRGILGTVCAGWRRALPLLTATIMLLPGGVTYAAQPASGPALATPTYQIGHTAIAGMAQADAERRCLIRCNDPENPPPPGRLRQGATKVRAAAQEVREEAREAVQDVREGAREAAPRVSEAATDVREAAGEAVESRVEEITASSAPPEATDSQAAAASLPAEAAAPEAQVASTIPAAATEPAAAAPPTEAAPSAAPPSTVAAASVPPAVAAVAPASPSSPPVPSQAAQVDPSSQSAGRQADGVAGGLNASAQRPEPGQFSQSRGAAPVAPVESAVPDASSAAPVAGSPTVADPSAPVAVQAPAGPPPVDALPAAPSASAGANVPPGAIAEASAAPSVVEPPAPPQIELADWSLPLTIAGGLLAGLALVFLMARRQRSANGQSYTADSGSTYPGEASASAYGAAVAAHADDRLQTYPGASHTLSSGPTRAGTTEPARSARSVGAVSSNVRLNGSPVPYLTPVRNRSDHQSEPPQDTAGRSLGGHSTNVAGLYWAEPSADDRLDRARA